MRARSEWRPGRAAMIVAVAAASVLGPGDAACQEVFRLSGPEVAIYDLAGAVRLVPGVGPDVVVRVTRGGAEAGALRIEVGEVGGRNALRVLYPEDDIVYPALGDRSRTELRVADDGTFSDGRSRGGRRVTIRGGGGGLEAWADLVVEVPEGRRVETRLAVGRVDAEGVRGSLLVDTGAGAVTITDVVGDVDVDTGSGAIELDGLEGALRADTGSGAITAARLRGGDVELDTGSGQIRVEDAAARSLLVDTGSGAVRLASIRAAVVEVDTGSGGVEVEVSSELEELLVDTGSGAVRVTVPPDFGAELEIETGSGRIEVDLPVRVRRLERTELSGTVGDGGARVRVDTGSGNVRLVATGGSR